MGNVTKLQRTNKGQYTVTVPRALVKAVGMQAGNRVRWNVVSVEKLELHLR
ncbi:MAG: hypothetical protein OXR66_04480 [Candidatus Woesearchaeota archaeon]|nr:hypothetical protein [Candidatus Woesearchaeota archaeon]